MKIINIKLDEFHPRYFADDPPQEYYTNDNTNELAQEIHDNPNLRILFDASKNLTTDDIKIVIDLVNRLKGN